MFISSNSALNSFRPRDDYLDLYGWSYTYKSLTADLIFHCQLSISIPLQILPKKSHLNFLQNINMELLSS